MTETTSVDHAHSGRLSRTRLSVRTAITIERLWPLLLPFLVIVALFVSLSWLGIFRLMPGTLRQMCRHGGVPSSIFRRGYTFNAVAAQ